YSHHETVAETDAPWRPVSARTVGSARGSGRRRARRPRGTGLENGPPASALRRTRTGHRADRSAHRLSTAEVGVARRAPGRARGRRARTPAARGLSLARVVVRFGQEAAHLLAELAQSVLLLRGLGELLGCEHFADLQRRRERLL